MRIGQVLANAPTDCTLVTIYASVYYSTPRYYQLTGYAYGEVGDRGKRVRFERPEEQTEFNDAQFDSAVRNAGFYMPQRPIKGTGTEYIYYLRPTPADTPIEQNFSLHSRSQGNIEKRLQEEAFMIAFESRLANSQQEPYIDF